MEKSESLGKKLFVTAYYKRNQRDEWITQTHLVPNLNLANVEEQEPGTLRACYFFVADAFKMASTYCPLVNTIADQV